MKEQRLKQLLKFLVEVEKLKLVERRVKLSSRKHWESTAEHSWDLAIWTWVFSKDLPRNLDLLKTMKLVLMHDLVEIYAGDTFFFDQKARLDKKEREDAAAKKLFAKLPGDLREEFNGLWREFEARKTKEAKIALSMDRLQPILQNTLSGGYSWKLHKVTKSDLIKYKRDNMLHDKNILKIFEFLIAEARRKKLI